MDLVYNKLIALQKALLERAIVDLLIDIRYDVHMGKGSTTDNKKNFIEGDLRALVFNGNVGDFIESIQNIFIHRGSDYYLKSMNIKEVNAEFSYFLLTYCHTIALNGLFEEAKAIHEDPELIGCFEKVKINLKDENFLERSKRSIEKAIRWVNTLHPSCEEMERKIIEELQIIFDVLLLPRDHTPRNKKNIDLTIAEGVIATKQKDSNDLFAKKSIGPYA